MNRTFNRTKTDKYAAHTKCKRNNGCISFSEILIFLLNWLRQRKLLAHFPVPEAYTKPLALIFFLGYLRMTVTDYKSLNISILFLH